ncbi:YfaP family protein [Algiphilus sp.]|uniref:YfaP family protein n=1 Tax=Algiphilus sp. TaxID=1872431 RepID=UPI003B520CF7
MRKTRNHSIASLLTIFLLSTISGCGGGGSTSTTNNPSADPGTPSLTPNAANDLLIKFGGELAELKRGTTVPEPSNDSDQPQIQIIKERSNGANGSVVQTPVSIRSNDLISTLYAKISGTDDVFELNLLNEESDASVQGSEVFDTNLEIALQPDIKQGRVPIEIVAVDNSGRVSAPSISELDVLQVGTGGLQISLNWNEFADLDLHIFDPNGDEIYYAQPSSTSGGRLDLDDFDGSPDSIENVFWPQEAPQGIYNIEVNHFTGEPANIALGISYNGRFVDTLRFVDFLPEYDCVRFASIVVDLNGARLVKFPTPVSTCNASGSIADEVPQSRDHSPTAVFERIQGTWKSCVLGLELVRVFEGTRFTASIDRFEFNDCTGRKIAPTEINVYDFEVGNPRRTPEGFFINEFDVTVLSSTTAGEGFVGEDFYQQIYSDDIQIAFSFGGPTPSDRPLNLDFEYPGFRID